MSKWNSPDQWQSPRQLTIERTVIITVSIAAMLAGAASMVLLWQTGTTAHLPARIDETMSTVSGMLILAVTILIAWRAGDHPPNLSIALSLTFVYGSVTISPLLQKPLHPGTLYSDAGVLLLFLLGAGFYLRASQLFPRTLTPHDIASNRTIWGRIAPLRASLIFLLRPATVWTFVISVTLLFALTSSTDVGEAIRLLIVAIGLVFFYIMYRVGDPATRRKVLWFLEVAVAALVVGLLGEAVRAVLHGNSTPTVRNTLLLLIQFMNYSAQVICISAAVFYAGAVSPGLVIRKTFVYGVTAALLLFAYATVEAYFVSLLVDVAGISDRFAGALLGAIIGLAFHPIRERMERMMTHFRHIPAAAQQHRVAE